MFQIPDPRCQIPRPSCIQIQQAMLATLRSMGIVVLDPAWRSKIDEKNTTFNSQFQYDLHLLGNLVLATQNKKQDGTDRF